MFALVRDLVRHKRYASDSLLKAIGQSEAAVQDAEIRRLLHHIVVANRFWLLLSLGLPFASEERAEIPSFEAILGLYGELHAQETEWTSRLKEADLDSMVETAFIPGGRFSVGQAMTQVCLHSHAHRAQCATRLRLLGGTPPQTDFILWLNERPVLEP